MKILHFAESGEVVGGVERYLATLLGASTPGLEHAVVTHAGGPCAFAGRWPAAAWPWMGPRLPDGPLPPLGDVPLFHAPPAPAALAALGETPFAVFCHDHRWWCPSGSRYYRRTGAACGIRASTLACGPRYHLLRCGSLRPGATLTGFARAAVARETLGQAGAVLCASAWMRDEAVRHGAHSARTHLVPLPAPARPGIPEGTSRALQATGTDGSSPPVILCASRLTPEKGVEELLAAFGALRVPAQLVIAGDGIQSAWIAELARVHPQSKRITLAGRVPDAAMAELYAQASLVAVPSLWPEPFGLVGLEALAWGLPVVASGSGGSADWAREELGVLTAEPRDADGFAAALAAALTDPVWRTRAAGAGAAFVAVRHSVPAHESALTAALAGLAVEGVVT